MEVRRRTTLSEQLAVLQSSNLRNLLRVREDGEEAEAEAGRGRRAALTLGAVLASEKREASAAAAGSRTLFEIIRDEEEEAGGSGGGSGWRALRDFLRLGRLSDPSPDPSPVSAEIAAEVTEGASGRREEAEEGGGVGGGEGGVEDQPVRVSLMALLEEADRQGPGGGLLAAGETEGDEAEEGVAVGGVVGMSVCCVCMVRHKGAAFIPCGHTFCRACAREVWATRGACPLCNGLILEILDIF